MRYLFDSSALVAVLKGEPNSAKIKSLLDLVEAGKSEGGLSAVSLTELIYLFGKEGHEYVAWLEQSNLQILDIDRSIAKKAGELRHAHPKDSLSTADCLIMATAIQHKADQVVSLDKDWRKVKEITLTLL